MADQRLITLYPGDASPKNIILRPMAVADVPSTTIYLYAGDATPKNIVLSDPKVQRQTGGAQDATTPTVSATWTYSAPSITPQVSTNATAPTVAATLTYAAPVVTPIVQIDATVPTISAAVTYLAQAPTPSITENATAPTVYAGVTYTASAQAPVISGDATTPTVFASITWEASVGEIGIYLPTIAPGISTNVTSYGGPTTPTPAKRTKLKPLPVVVDAVAPLVFGTFRIAATSCTPAVVQLHRTRSTRARRHRIATPAILPAALIRSKPTFLPLIRS
jgi:hypothetical protein